MSQIKQRFNEAQSHNSDEKNNVWENTFAQILASSNSKREAWLNQTVVFLNVTVALDACAECHGGINGTFIIDSK